MRQHDLRGTRASDHLDFIRGLAALAVVYSHARVLLIESVSSRTGPIVRLLYLLSGYGHSAVMVFFVGVLSKVVFGDFQAAGFSLIPSTNMVPLTTSASSGDPFNDRHPFDALSISLNTIVRHAARLPLPLVLS